MRKDPVVFINNNAQPYHFFLEPYEEKENVENLIAVTNTAWNFV